VNSIAIRKARAGDESIIIALLREFAVYEKFEDKFRLTEKQVARDFFGASTHVFSALAFQGGAPVAVATWYFTYATFAPSRALYIEDLYVRAEARGAGTGRALMAWLAREAMTEGADRIEWSVLNWNTSAMAFYDKIGAQPVTDWVAYRLSGNALAELAQS
jgi:GNAT superfamily N-acetyltransferase